MRIFIIGGKAGSGKNYLAKLIKNYYDRKNSKSIITEYSKYLKLYAKEMINWQGDSPKPRKFLQELGLLIRNEIDSTFLINRIKQDLKVYAKYYNNVIISDARFIEEYETIKKEYDNVTTIRVINNNGNDLLEEEKNHLSELALDNYNNVDYLIEIDNIKELDYKIEKILEEVK